VQGLRELHIDLPSMRRQPLRDRLFLEQIIEEVLA